jgi:hypothetical protein
VVILAAAVAVVGALCLVDLVLTLGVLRRLREHTEIINQQYGPRQMQVMGLAPADTVPPFATVTVGGEPVTGPSGLRMVAFFSTSCSICPERVPPFVEYLSAHGLAPESALAVIVGPAKELPPYASPLPQVAQVCLEAENGAVGSAFKVAGYPAFCLLDETGVVAATGYNPTMLPEPEPASAR